MEENVKVPENCEQLCVRDAWQTWRMNQLTDLKSFEFEIFFCFRGNL